MDTIKTRIESVMDTHDVVVAILAPQNMHNSLEAREVFKEYVSTLLSVTSPAMYAKGDTAFVYGVTAKMKKNPEYYLDFVDACQNYEYPENIEIFGMSSEI